MQDLDTVRSWFPKIREMAMGHGDLNIDTKSSSRDLVTDVDKGVEAFLRQEILALDPDAVILGEETNQEGVDLDAGHLWVLDPIDGTTNFVKMGENYGTLLAYFENGQPVFAYVYNIYRDELYQAVSGRGISMNGQALAKPANLGLAESLVALPVRDLAGRAALPKILEACFDMRNYGASSMDGIAVVKGQFGAFVNPKGGPWDYAPYFCFSQEAGLHFSAYDGSPARLDRPNGFVLSTEACWADMKDWLLSKNSNNG